MGKIGAQNDIASGTLFSGYEVPVFGVPTDHEAELEKVGLSIRISLLISFIT